MKKTINKKKYKLIDNPFPNDEDIIEELSDPNYEGNIGLPSTPTSSQTTKYEICQSILDYKFAEKLSVENLAEQIELSKAETKELLLCHIEKFTLDRLFTYTEKLNIPLQIVKTPHRSKISNHHSHKCPVHGR